MAARPARDGDGSDARAQQSALLARVMDDLVTIPGTNFGVGLDGLIGLVPGVGDSVSTTLAGAILVDAVRHRVPMDVLLRMAFNLLVDTALGYVPLVGDAADFAHRANRKNYQLLRRALDEGRSVDESYPLYLVRAGGLLVGVLLVMVASAVFTIWATLAILVQLLG